MKRLLCQTFFLLIFSICSSFAIAQRDSVKIDSLKKVLATEKEDTNKVKTLNELSYQYYKNTDTNATNFAHIALKLAKETNFKTGIARAYINLGNAALRRDYDEALKNYLIALGISQQIKDDKGIAASFFNIGYNYSLRNNIGEALKFYNNSLLVYKKINDEPNVAHTYLGIGNIYENKVYNSKEALKYYDSALSRYKKINIQTDIANCYMSIAASYYEDNQPEALKNYYAALSIYEAEGDKINMGNCYQYIGSITDKDSSKLKFLFLSLKIREETGDKGAIAQTCLTIGGAYLAEAQYEKAAQYDSMGYIMYKELKSKRYDWGIPFALSSMASVYTNQGAVMEGINKTEAYKKYEKALKFDLSALEEWKKINRPDAYAGQLSAIGYLYLKLNNINKAKSYLKESAEQGKNYNGREGIMNSYINFSKADSIEGNYKEAYNNYKKYIIYRDSIYNDESTKKSLQTSMQYDFDKKEAIAKAAQAKKDADAKRIKNQQYFAIGALGIVVLTVVIIALIQFRNNKQKQKANNLITQQKQQVESTLEELKSTQTQLIQSEKMASLGELTAGIAHEIQNPLNFVNNFSEVNKEMLAELKEEIDKGNFEEVKLIAGNIEANEEKINHHGRRADAIVKGMLQHSRKNNGIKEPTDINKLADEYLRLSYHGLRAKDKNFNAGFKMDFDDSIGKIDIVPQDMGRVLLNLFNNAFYAVNAKMKTAGDNYKPLVTVRTKKNTGNIEIKVEDNGNGIPQNVIDKIFQPFFTTKPTGQGTGLGLSLSFDIITKEHNGTITADSKEGEGSIFIITLSS